MSVDVLSGEGGLGYMLKGREGCCKGEEGKLTEKSECNRYRGCNCWCGCGCNERYESR